MGSWNAFKTQCIDTLKRIQQKIDLHQVNEHQSASKLTKFALRTVVDVKIKQNWCPGTVIQRFYDDSIKIALHSDDLDGDGMYCYVSHCRVRKEELLNNKVVACVDEEGEYEIDRNPKLQIDTNRNLSLSQQSSPSKSPKKIQQILQNQNRNRMDVENLESNLSQIAISNQISPNSQIKKRRRSPRRKQRKRSREEMKNETKESQNPSKRRKVVSDDEIAKNAKPQRRQSLRLQQQKEKKEKIQTKICGTKDRKISFSKVSNNKNKNQESEQESDGEEIEWSDDMSDNMKKLAKTKIVKKRKKGKRREWTQEAMDALRKCYAKHDKKRKKFANYQIWVQITQDDEYCKFWGDRTSVSIRDKARTLLGLGKKKKKKKTKK